MSKIDLAHARRWLDAVRVATGNDAVESIIIRMWYEYQRASLHGQELAIIVAFIDIVQCLAGAPQLQQGFLQYLPCYM